MAREEHFLSTLCGAGMLFLSAGKNIAAINLRLNPYLKVFFLLFQDI